MAPHGELTVNGWGVYAGGILLAVVLLGAIVLLVNALVRPRYHFGRLGPWGYVTIASVFLLIAFGVFFIRITGYGKGFAGTLILMLFGGTVVMLVTEIMYLLGVVFPDDTDREKRAQFERDNGIVSHEKKKDVKKQAALENAQKQSELYEQKNRASGGGSNSAGRTEPAHPDEGLFEDVD